MKNQIRMHSGVISRPQHLSLKIADGGVYQDG